MVYQIDSKLAKEVGFVGAIMFTHISYWINKNKANNKHFHDGEYWTYSSARGFAEYFEDLTENQIRQGLNNLIEKGYLKIGNYNKIKYDRTQWYAFAKNPNSICEKSQMDLRHFANRFDKTCKPIPDIITNNNNIYIDSSTSSDVPHTKANKFIPPTIEQLEAYGKSKGFKKTNYLDFWEFYENKGWKVGNVKMKSWQLALNRWERNQKEKGFYGNKRATIRESTYENGF